MDMTLGGDGLSRRRVVGHNDPLNPGLAEHRCKHLAHGADQGTTVFSESVFLGLGGIVRLALVGAANDTDCLVEQKEPVDLGAAVSAASDRGDQSVIRGAIGL